MFLALIFRMQHYVDMHMHDTTTQHQSRIHNTLLPVSYTHLDVYKRQVQEINIHKIYKELRLI